MSATGILLIGMAVAGGLLLLGIFAVAIRRGPTEGPITSAELDRKAVKADRAAAEAKAAEAKVVDSTEATAVATLERTDEETEPGPPPPDPMLERTDVTENEYGVTRRQFFNRALYAVFGLFLAQFALASLAFVWPKLKGGFGTPINVGNVEAIKSQIRQGGTVFPEFVAAAQSWLVPFEMSLLDGSSYEGVPFVVAGGESDGLGVMALWQRCVHLGCRVPDCVPSQGFECPCHGSKYNIHGEYEAGPAPRNMDRFGVSVNDAGDLIVDTGAIVQTPRSKNKTAPYPQGPFCV